MIPLEPGEREGWLVLDLGFGDAGKGSITDFLVRDRGAGLVIRHNGGAQAGHNVLTPEGVHHTFSQFGAGHLAGAEGLLGPDFLLHPLAMAVEAEVLGRKGPDPWARTLVDARARVISPYQQAMGRLREQARGERAHGSCGVGIGERVADGLAFPDDAIVAADLGDPPKLRRCLERQRERKREELRNIGLSDQPIFDDPGLIDRVVEAWTSVAGRLRLATPDAVRERIQRERVVIFEGAQGVLLDETWGFHPHTTWSDTTGGGAGALSDRPLRRLGLLRAYHCRHGAGPFPTEGSLRLAEPHNGDEGFQGRFRTGALDGVLLRYALEVCPVDGLAITCLDRVDRPPCASTYEAAAAPALWREGRLVPGAPEDLGHRERLGAFLRTVRPVMEPRDPLAFVEEQAGLAAWLMSWGPSAREKGWRGAGRVRR